MQPKSVFCCFVPNSVLLYSSSVVKAMWIMSWFHFLSFDLFTTAMVFSPTRRQSLLLLFNLKLFYSRQLILSQVGQLAFICFVWFLFFQRLLPDIPRSTRPPSPPTLDLIVTRYLREQHAQCNNPVSAGPPFSLLRWVVNDLYQPDKLLVQMHAR